MKKADAEELAKGARRESRQLSIQLISLQKEWAAAKERNKQTKLAVKIARKAARQARHEAKMLKRDLLAVQEAFRKAEKKASRAEHKAAKGEKKEAKKVRKPKPVKGAIASDDKLDGSPPPEAGRPAPNALPVPAIEIAPRSKIRHD